MMLNCLLGEEVVVVVVSRGGSDMWGRRSHVSRPGTGGRRGEGGRGGGARCV